MKPIRLYRKFNDPSFPLTLTLYPTRRIMHSYVNVHWHPEPELLYIQDGDYEIYSEKGDFTLHTGEICLIPPSKVHAIRALCPTGNYWSICFSIDLIQMADMHFFQQAFVEPLKSGALQIPNKFSQQKGLTPKATASIHQILHGDQGQQFLGLFSFLLEILPVCRKVTKNTDLRQSSNATAACIRYMEANYSTRITLQELAEHVHLHPNYLCSVFKRNAGQTIFAYLNTLRIRKARTLLAKGNLSISQVAEQVGYADIDHFSHTFKQIIGISPSEYRRTYNEN